MKKEITAFYNGIKRTPGDRDNLPKKEHEFVAVGSDKLLRYKDIKLLQKAALQKGKQYVIGFEDDSLYLPVSIAADGTIFLRETSNKIVSIDQQGNKINHSDRPIIKRLGQALKDHNKKLIAEGKPPIKPIKRRW